MDHRDANHRAQRSQEPNVFEAERLCVAWGLIKDPAVQIALASWKENPFDREAREFVLSTMDEYSQAQNIAPNPFAATAPTRFDTVDGEIMLGLTASGTIYGIDGDALCRNLAVIGATGSGKTNFIRNLMKQFHQSHESCGLLITAEKRNLGREEGSSDDFVIIPTHLFRDNLLRNTPGVDLADHKNAVSELFCDLDTRFASRSYLLETLEEMYDDFGFTGSEHQVCPNIRHLHERLSRKRHSGFSNLERHRETMQVRTGGILSHSGATFVCDHGILLKNLVRTHVVIELDGRTPEIRKLIITSLLYRMLLYFLATGERTSKIRQLIIIDEAQDLMRRQGELQDTASPLGHLVTLAREHGCGLVIGLQNCRDLSYSFASNCAHKIGTGFTDMRDLDEFCRMIG